MFVYVTAVVVTLAAVALVLRYRRRRTPASRLRRVLRDASRDWLRDLVIPDDIDGHIHLEHVLRTDAGFVVIDITRVDGAVFGAAGIDEWTVMHRGQSRKFRNPVQPNRNRVLAIRSLAPGVPVHGLVILLGAVDFPKGRPEGVVTLGGLRDALDALPRAKQSQDWDDAWIALSACTHNQP